MDETSDVATSVPTSLDAILEQMEVSTEPDIHTLDVINTACAEDLLLGGEVEICDAAEVRHPSASQRQEVESNENLIMQGGAEGEERPEDAIGMEIEVTRKSSCSSDPVSPTEPPDDERGGGEVVTDEASCGVVRTVAEEQLVVEERRAQGERGRKRDLYIPPVTEWRDFLDSQDILREYARNTGQGEGGGEEGGEMVSRGEGGERTNAESQESAASDADREIDVEGVGEMEQEHPQQDNEVFGGSEIETDEIVDVVEVENREEEQDNHPMQEDTEDSDPSVNKIGQPDHLEMFCPSRIPLGPPTTRTANSARRDLEVAEEFLEQEKELLLKARWVPEISPQPVAQASSTNESRPRGDVQATPVISGGAVRPTAPSHTSTCSSNTIRHNSSDRTTEASRVSGNTPSTKQDSRLHSETRRPASSVQPSSRAGENHVTAILREDRSDSQDSFFNHDSQMDTGGGEESQRPVVTLYSPSASSAYESAVEVQAAREKTTNQPSPERNTGNKIAALSGEKTPQRVARCNKRDIYSRSPDNHAGNETSSKQREGKVLQQQPMVRPVSVSCAGYPTKSPIGSPIGSPTGSRGTSQSGRELMGCTQIAQHQREGMLSRDAHTLSPMEDTASDVEETSDPRREGREEMIKGRAGQKGKRPQPKECHVKIQKFPLNKIIRQFRTNTEPASEEPDIADLLVNICLQMPTRPCQDKWTEFHDFVANLPLPSVSRIATSVHTCTASATVKGSDGVAEKEELSDHSDVPSPQPLFDSLVEATASVAGKDGWLGLDQLLDDIPESVMTGRGEVAIETESRDPESDCLPNTQLHQQSHHHGREQSPPAVTKPSPSLECPMHIKKIIHSFWFRYSIALSQSTSETNINHT